jgi:hypothetical protein
VDGETAAEKKEREEESARTTRETRLKTASTEMARVWTEQHDPEIRRTLHHVEGSQFEFGLDERARKSVTSCVNAHGWPVTNEMTGAVARRAITDEVVNLVKAAPSQKAEIKRLVERHDCSTLDY